MGSNASCSRRSPAVLAVLVVQHVFLGDPAAAQDFSVLRINEVIPRNHTQGPTSSLGQHHDMIEIYNSGDVPLTLGRPTFRERVGITDTATLPILGLWTFPVGSTIQPRGFLVVFINGDSDGCDLGTHWELPSDGSRPITLWGPMRADGKRPMIDQLWLPPLPKDVSFGRRVDGAGPAPMPVAETLAHFCYFPAGSTTFGTCSGGCATFDRSCTGAPNGPCGNIPPRIRIQEWSTNAPAAAEDVTLTVRVSDDQDPVPPDLRRVFIRYRVNGSAVMS